LIIDLYMGVRVREMPGKFLGKVDLSFKIMSSKTSNHGTNVSLNYKKKKKKKINSPVLSFFFFSFQI
jgi:hypothetical protein